LDEVLVALLDQLSAEMLADYLEIGMAEKLEQWTEHWLVE
jgi:hypothetical protein